MPVLHFLRGCVFILAHLYTLSSTQIQLEISFTSMSFSLFPFFCNTSEKSTRAQQYKIGIHKHMYLVKIRKQAPKSIQKETKRQGYPWIKLQLLSAVLSNTFLKCEYFPLFQDQLKMFSSALKIPWYSSNSSKSNLSITDVTCLLQEKDTEMQVVHSKL